MRIIFKILLFPVTLALSVFVTVCRFVCHFSGALFSVASGIVFTIAFLGLVLPVAKLPIQTHVMLFALAFAISPFGIPMLAVWLLDRLDNLNLAIRSI